MTVPQKILFSFLLSALFCAGIATLALTGIIGKGVRITGLSVQIVILAVVFSTSFLIIFLCLNLRRDSVKTSEVVYEQNGIHYINSKVFTDDKDSADIKSEEFDNNFANLVESVVNKKELTL